MSYNSVPSYNSDIFTENPVYGDSKDNRLKESFSYVSENENYREILKTNLNILKSKADTLIVDLSDEYLKSFDLIISSLKVLQGNEEDYSQIYNNVMEIFNTDKPVVNRTVRSFFLSCFNSENQKGVIGCNPKCLQSANVEDKSTCEDLVLAFSKNKITKLNNKLSHHAYIFIQDKNFKGFKSSNIKEIKDFNIKDVTLIYDLKQTNQSRENQDVFTVDELPVVSNSSIVWISILFVVIILFIAYLIFRERN